MAGFDVRDKGYVCIKGIEIFGATVKTNEKSVAFQKHPRQPRRRCGVDCTSCER